MSNNHITYLQLRNIKLCQFKFFGFDYLISNYWGDGGMNYQTAFKDDWGIEVINGELNVGRGETNWMCGNGCLENYFWGMERVNDE